jgi:uncharacterized protein DUF1524/excalibur calcium-binding domain-containing protein
VAWCGYDRPLATPVIRNPALASVAVLLLGLTAACSSSTGGPPGPTTAPTPTSTSTSMSTHASVGPGSTAPTLPTGGTALAGLAALPIKGRAPMTGYARTRFGQAWSDDTAQPFGHNGCDTRNDILRRDLKAIVVKAGTAGCVALSGRLDDPYTAVAIAFQRGVATSTEVQIDHVVALGDAWRSGAQQLSETQRQGLANDPLNLLAVDGPANLQKSDSDAASWLPANKAFRCTYVARQVVVKLKWRLWVTAAEHAAVTAVLASCPNQPLAAEPGALGRIVVRAGPSASSKATPAPVLSATGTGAYYANCSAVRSAGRAPLHRGQPGYRPALDRDGDGVACE